MKIKEGTKFKNGNLRGTVRAILTDSEGTWIIFDCGEGHRRFITSGEIFERTYEILPEDELIYKNIYCNGVIGSGWSTRTLCDANSSLYVQRTYVLVYNCSTGEATLKKV